MLQCYLHRWWYLHCFDQMDDDNLLQRSSIIADIVWAAFLNNKEMTFHFHDDIAETRILQICSFQRNFSYFPDCPAGSCYSKLLWIPPPAHQGQSLTRLVKSSSVANVIFLLNRSAVWRHTSPEPIRTLRTTWRCWGSQRRDQRAPPPPPSWTPAGRRSGRRGRSQSLLSDQGTSPGSNPHLPTHRQNHAMSASILTRVQSSAGSRAIRSKVASKMWLCTFVVLKLLGI